jgi:uncharacterized protein with PhoU and TrkA domain
VAESACLDVAVEAMTAATQHWVPALDPARKVAGTVATSDVVRGYRLGLLASLQRMNLADADGEAGRSERVRIEPASLLATKSLRNAGLPLTAIVTTIQRNRDLVVPSGDTVLAPGDELVLIGSTSDLSVVRDLATDSGRD